MHMAFWHGRSHRTPTGALVMRIRKKKKMDRGTEAAFTHLDKRKSKRKRSRGSTDKISLMSSDVANVFDKSTGKAVKSKILTVVKNPANPHLARRNIMNKGAIIKTELGNAVVTSRPGQDGVINAILQKEK